MFLPTGLNSSSNHLYMAFLVSMCLLPFSTGGGKGSDSVVITFALPFLLLLSIFIVYNLTTAREKASYPNEIRFSIFYALLHVFSIFISSLMNQSLTAAFARSIFHLFGFTIFLYIVSNSSMSKNATLVYNKISMILIFSGFLMSVYFIGNFVFAIQQNSLEQVLLERGNGGLLSLPWGASNTIAACLMMPFFLALDRIINTRYVKKIGIKSTVFMVFIIAVAILITQSRNVIVVLSIGLPLIGIFTKNKKSVLVILMLIAAVVFAVVSFSGQDFDGIVAARIGDRAEDVSGFNGRTFIWEESILYFSTHPLQPVGYFGMLDEIGHTAHNIFITTLIEQGALGLIAYILFLFDNFLFCFKKMSTQYLSLITKKRIVLYLVAMLSILVQYQFEDSNFTAPNIIYQWVFISLMYLSVYSDIQYSESRVPQYSLPPAKD